MIRPIGGFLPLCVPVAPPRGPSVLAHWTQGAASVWRLHNARSGLHALWNLLRPRAVWLPAYVCEEVAKAVPPGIAIRYYALDDELHPLLDAMSASIEDGDHVVAMGYFGRPVRADLKALARSRPHVGWIEDRAQALDAGPPWADWAVYSPRKLLGVPDGGLLVARHEALPPLSARDAADVSFMHACIARYEDRDEQDNDRWYAEYRRAESAMSCDRQAMSRLSEAVLAGIDLEDHAQRRRDNYRVLHELLHDLAFHREPSIDFAPLGMPIRVSSAESLSKRLAERRIFAARHWRTLPSDPQQHAHEHGLAGELLTLPCDYRYGEPEMKRIAEAVRECLAAP